MGQMWELKLKSLEEIRGRNLSAPGLDNDFLDVTPKAQMTKEKIIGKSDFIRTKNFVLQITP